MMKLASTLQILKADLDESSLEVTNNKVLSNNNIAYVLETWDKSPHSAFSLSH